MDQFVLQCQVVSPGLTKFGTGNASAGGGVGDN